MIRLVPRSLAGQMAVLIGVALLIAQLANFALILNERQRLGLAQNEGPAIDRFVAVAAEAAETPAAFRRLVVGEASRRGARFSTGPATLVREQAERQADTEDRLRRSLAAAGVPVREVRAAWGAMRPQMRDRAGSPIQGDMRRGRRGGNMRVLLLSVQLGDGQWLDGRLATPRRDPLLTARLVAATLLLYVIVLGATLFIARRLARPLGDLTRAAERFEGRGSPAAVTPAGPGDLRRAIEAFNAMNHRVVALLDEKDRMLGAIGHDLRTPLASLRIRAEAMEPEEERQRMVATIEEMTTTLEDILVLARSGRARESARSVDVTALADAVVEEYREQGADVALEPSDRHVVPVQSNLLRRALRNLIDNGVNYAGAARVAVGRSGDAVEIAVRDDGPGIPAAELEKVFEPFYRIEASRSRETGGTGLGLAIARAVAESHGGTLRLANRPEGGLVATLSLPLVRHA
jgi:signal transduction histidine kinase